MVKGVRLRVGIHPGTGRRVYERNRLLLDNGLDPVVARVTVLLGFESGLDKSGEAWGSLGEGLGKS